MTITFTVQGDPKPQPRPRAFARNLGGGKFAARVYDAGTAEGWKACVALAAKPYIPHAPFNGPLEVHLDFIMSRPKGHYNSKGAIKPTAPNFPTNKMDADNLAKAVLDCLTQLGMWQDDGQIVNLNISKRYGVTMRLSGVLVTIEAF